MEPFLSKSKRRQRDRMERRGQILESARVVFGQRGVAAATMDDVAHHAQLSKGTLYLYFQSKDELFMALASECIGQALDAFDALSNDTSICGRDELHRLVHKWAEIALTDPTTIRNAFVWLAAGEEIDTTTDGFRSYRESVQSLHKYLGQAISRGKKDGSIAADTDPTTLTVQLWGCLMGALVLRINAKELQRRIPNPVDEQRIVPGVIDMLFSGLKAEAEKSA